jgi:hypothetical protein
MHAQGHGQAESKEYYELKDLVMEEVEPRNLTEVFLARDIGDAEWEISRLRGLKPGVIHAMIPRAIKSQIADSGDAAPLDPKLVPTIRKHVVAMIAGDPHTRQALESMLAEHHLTVDIIGAATFVDTIGAQVHIDRMAAAAGDAGSRSGDGGAGRGGTGQQLHERVGPVRSGRPRKFVSPPNSVGNVRSLPPWVRLGGKRSDKKLVGDGLP